MAECSTVLPKSSTDAGWRGKHWITDEKRAVIVYHPLRGQGMCTYQATKACRTRYGAFDLSYHGGRPSIDHVLPRNQGGTNHASNLVSCCVACNSARPKQGTLSLWLETVFADEPSMLTRVLSRVLEQVEAPVDLAWGKRYVAHLNVVEAAR